MKQTSTTKSGGRPRRNPKASASASFSVRLNSEERGWVEEAANISQVAVASLVRKAAVDRACDILNFSGAEDELRPLAEKLASQLNPRTTCIDDTDPYETEGPRAGDIKFGPGPDPANLRITGVSHFSPTEIEILLDVLGTATTPFVEMLVQCIRDLTERRGGYKPVVDRRGLSSQSAVVDSAHARQKGRKSRGGDDR